MVRRQPIPNLLSRTAGRCSRHFSLFLHRIAPKAHTHFPTHLRAIKPSLHCQLDSQFRTAGATGSFKHTGGESLGFSCQQQNRKWYLVKSHGAKRGQSGGSRRDRRQEEPAGTPAARGLWIRLQKPEPACSPGHPGAVPQHTGPGAAHQNQSPAHTVRVTGHFHRAGTTGIPSKCHTSGTAQQSTARELWRGRQALPTH